jgi:arsenate reductase
VRYEDPKAFDDSPEEASQYDARSRQIAGEMFYVFSRVSI